MNRTHIVVTFAAIATVFATSYADPSHDNDRPIPSALRASLDGIKTEAVPAPEMSEAYDVDALYQRGLDLKNNDLIGLQHHAEGGTLPVVFEHEKARIAAVLNRATGHLDTLLQALRVDPAVVAPVLTEMCDMYQGLGERITTMLAADVQQVRVQAVQASERLRHATVRGHDDTTLAAIAVHNAIARAIHPAAFSKGGALTRVKRLFRDADGKRNNTPYFIMGGVLVAVALVGSALFIHRVGQLQASQGDDQQPLRDAAAGPDDALQTESSRSLKEVLGDHGQRTRSKRVGKTPLAWLTMKAGSFDAAANADNPDQAKLQKMVMDMIDADPSWYATTGSLADVRNYLVEAQHNLTQAVASGNQKKVTAAGKRLRACEADYNRAKATVEWACARCNPPMQLKENVQALLTAPVAPAQQQPVQQEQSAAESAAV